MSRTLQQDMEEIRAIAQVAHEITPMERDTLEKIIDDTRSLDFCYGIYVATNIMIRAATIENRDIDKNLIHFVHHACQKIVQKIDAQIVEEKNYDPRFTSTQ